MGSPAPATEEQELTLKLGGAAVREEEGGGMAGTLKVESCTRMLGASERKESPMTWLTILEASESDSAAMRPRLDTSAIP